MSPDGKQLIRNFDISLNDYVTYEYYDDGSFRTKTEYDNGTKLVTHYNDDGYTIERYNYQGEFEYKSYYIDGKLTDTVNEIDGILTLIDYFNFFH